MKFAAGLLVGICLGWVLAGQYPGGIDAIVNHLRAAVQGTMPWVK